MVIFAYLVPLLSLNIIEHHSVPKYYGYLRINIEYKL